MPKKGCNYVNHMISLPQFLEPCIIGKLIATSIVWKATVDNSET